MISTSTIALILRSLGAAVQMPGVFGASAARLAPLLNTLASFSELPEKTRPAQEALLAQVRAWVAENRAPSDAELDEFQTKANALDVELRELQATLGKGDPTGGL